MLTSDLVRARRRRGGDLQLVPLSERDVPAARTFAAALVCATTGCVGATRGDWEEACRAIPVSSRLRKVADGLRKLVEDRCTFEIADGPPPPELRAEVFALASRRREALGPGEELDRDAVLDEVGAARGLTGALVDERLYADLKRARRLVAFEPLDADELLALWDSGQGQAVLLRASHVVVTLRDADPPALRRLFHKLKFLRLLHTLRALPEGGHRLEVDGPLSLFGPSTKYGLQLALLLPALERTAPFELEAEVLWGPARQRTTFRLQGGQDAAARAQPAGSDTTSRDEVDTLVERLRKLDSDWRVRRSTRVLDLPGVGLCVPDLVFSRERARVYLEVLGYWSRPAVWKRVELIEGGLKERILFCVSSRLRVGEQALGEEHPGSLYVFKGALDPRRVLDKIEQLAAR